MEEEPPAAVPLEEEEASQNHGSPSVPGVLSSGVGDTRVPVTLITGFLGAGKTTLINHILAQPHGYKIAVILNDFGDNLGIERALVRDDPMEENLAGGGELGEESAQPMVEEWVEVGNGCICCNVKHSFVLALEQLLERRERFDYILLETTGLANPGPVINMLWTDEELESPIRLDSVITVLDALNVLEQLQQRTDDSGSKLAQVQIAYADVVILNKLDLVDWNEKKIEDIENHIWAISTGVRIFRSVRSAIDVQQILNSQLFDLKTSQNEEFLEKWAEDDSGSKVTLEIGSFWFREPGSVDMEKLEAWLTGLLWEPHGAMEILRMKGAVCDHESGKPFIFQAVKQLYEVTESRQRALLGVSVNRVLVVGRNIEKDMVRIGFKECIHS